MSSLLTQYESRLDAVLAVAESQAGNGPGWLTGLRAQALRTFREHGVPTPKNEEWKYTPLRAFAESDWAIGEARKLEGQWFCEGSRRVLLVNGHHVSTTGPGGTAFNVTPMAEALQSDLSRFLNKAGAETTKTATREIRPDTYPFGELNTALFQDGAFIHVTGETDQVIEVCHVLTCPEGDDQPRLATPRLLIVADPGSKAKIVETYVTNPCSPNACMPVTEVFVGEGAEIEHVRVQDQCCCSMHIGLWQTRQAKDSTYTSFNIAYGSKLGRVDQTIWIGGEGCTTRLDGVVCAAKEQHIDNHTRLDHAVPNCNSFEIYKQVVADKATVVFNGKIFVHEDAQKTDAKQTNQALLLSPEATIDSKPQLEIFADDVKCTHGATVGQLEDLPLFYMRSRGVSREEAQAVLVYAFAAEVLELISIDPVREQLERRLYEKLGIQLSE